MNEAETPLSAPSTRWIYTDSMMLFQRKPKAAFSTPFSEFICNASSAEKKRVYKCVLEKASKRQNRVLDRVASAK